MSPSRIHHAYFQRYSKQSMPPASGTARPGNGPSPLFFDTMTSPYRTCRSHLPTPLVVDISPTGNRQPVHANPQDRSRSCPFHHPQPSSAAFTRSSLGSRVLGTSCLTVFSSSTRIVSSSIYFSTTSAKDERCCFLFTVQYCVVR